MKKFKLLLISLLATAMLVGCSSTKLSESYDEELLIQDAKDTINLMLEGEYQNIIDKFREELRSQLDAKEFEQQCESILSQVGEFESFGDATVVGTDNDLAVAVVFAEFSNGKVQFNVTYNEGMELEGFFLK